MNISLTPELKKYVQDKLASGFYTSVSEILREGLRALKGKDEVEKAKLEQLKLEIEKGLNSGRIKKTSRKDFIERIQDKSK